jgi:hypothetical protein
MSSGFAGGDGREAVEVGSSRGEPDAARVGWLSTAYENGDRASLTRCQPIVMARQRRRYGKTLGRVRAAMIRSADRGLWVIDRWGHVGYRRDDRPRDQKSSSPGGV